MARKNNKSGKKSRSSAPKVTPVQKKTSLKWLWYTIGAIAVIVFMANTMGGSDYPDMVTPKPLRGAEDAAVKIVEFSDIECPACRQMHPILKQIVEDYPDTVSWEFKHFPLSYHVNARTGARAAECANDQGKFWEMIDIMYENQNQLSKSSIEQWAQQLGMDETFNDCLTSGTKEKIIDANVREGRDLQVGGTPTIFVNGKRLTTLSYDALAAMIEAEV